MLMLDLFSLVVVLLGRLDPLALLITLKIRDECILLASSKIGRDFGWVANYHVVDVVIVDNVRNVSSCLLHLSISLLCVGDGRLLLEATFAIVNEVVVSLCLSLLILRADHRSLL